MFWFWLSIAFAIVSASLAGIAAFRIHRGRLRLDPVDDGIFMLDTDDKLVWFTMGSPVAAALAAARTAIGQLVTA